MLTYQDVETRVTCWIDQKVCAHPGEHIYVTLMLLATKPSERKDLFLELPAKSFRKYVKVECGGRGLLYSRSTEFRNPSTPSQNTDLGNGKVYMTVHHHFRELDEHYSSSLHWKPDSVYCAQQVDKAVRMVATVEQGLQSSQDKHINVELNVKQLANDVIDYIRKWIIDHWIQKQEEDKKKQIEDLKANESTVKEKN